ncbi:hypothetical protein Tco_1116827, partial [Tanacetum coccineum]
NDKASSPKSNPNNKPENPKQKQRLRRSLSVSAVSRTTTTTCEEEFLNMRYNPLYWGSPEEADNKMLLKGVAQLLGIQEVRWKLGAVVAPFPGLDFLRESLVSATPLSTAFFSTSIVQDFQDSPNDEEDTRSTQEYLNDLEEEYQARALIAKSKRFFDVVC